MPIKATTSPLFSAALRPDRSLHLAGGWVGLGVAAMVVAPLVIAVPAAALPVGVAFVGAGGGLSVLGVRQARRQRQSQQVTLWADQLEIAFHEGGARTLRRFAPGQVRLVLERDEDEKTTGFKLRAGEESLELGGFLSADDRASFAQAFGTALRKARASGQNRVA